MKKLLGDFKAFAFQGNMLDLAIGIVIGVAFAGVVDALVTNVLMELIAAVVGQPSFDSLVINIGDGAIHYGIFITALVNFLIVAFVLLLIVRAIRRVVDMRAQGSRECDYCKEFVAVDATRCKFCTSELVPLAG
ncbi:MAG: large conductance mechanosensitive channel protein MscL [Acidimicrobiia bacterium]